MLSVSCPIEVQGNKGFEDPTKVIYNYPWRRFNHLKRLDNELMNQLLEKQKALDGGYLSGNQTNYSDLPSYKIYQGQKEDYLKSKKSSTNEERFNNVQLGYGIKVLYGRVPGTVMLLPSTA